MPPKKRQASAVPGGSPNQGMPENGSPSKKKKNNTESEVDKNQSEKETPPPKSSQEVALSPEVLPRITAFTSTGADNITIPTVDLGTAYDAATARRLQSLELTPGFSGLLNLAMANPAMLSNGSPHIVLASDGLPATFWLMGMGTNSSLMSGTLSRQISVAFSGHTFARAMAVLGQVLGVNVLWAPSYKGGLALSSYRKKPDVANATTSSPGRRRGITAPSPVKLQATSSSSRFIETPVKKWNEDILLYDGREPFALSTYRSLPVLRHEVPEDSAVLVVFTAGTYVRPVQGQSLSLNIMSVILLANPAVEETDEPADIRKPFGVMDEVVSADADVTDTAVEEVVGEELI